MALSIKTLSPKEFKNYTKAHPVSCNYYQTPAGIIKVLTTDLGAHEASFEDQVSDAKPKKITSSTFSTLIITGTDFQLKVWQAALKIPAGETASYQDVALFVGKPDAWRAVATALGQNKIAYLIPCHRVVRKNGDLGGYKWGLDKKLALLKHEWGMPTNE